MPFGNKRETEETLYQHAICPLRSSSKEKTITLTFLPKICKVNLLFSCVLLSELKIYVACFFSKTRYFNTSRNCWNCKHFTVIGQRALVIFLRRSLLWFSYYKKKDYSSSVIANFTLRTDGIPVKAVCKGRLQWGFLEVYEFEYDSPIHWEPIPVTALVMIPI